MKALDFALVSALLSSEIPLFKANATECRCLPSDNCWPSDAAWQHLNMTVGGSLLATVPLGSRCHDPVYNAAECTLLQSEWLDPQLQ